MDKEFKPILSGQTVEALFKTLHFESHVAPWDESSMKKLRKDQLNGKAGEQITFRFDDGGRVYNTKKSFEGVISNLRRRFDETG